MANAKKARTIEVNYLTKEGAYLSDERGEYIEFKVTGTTNQSTKLYPSELDPALQQRAKFHGFNQKVRDAAAGKDEKDQLPAMQEVIDVLISGKWDKAREAVQITDERLAKAMMRVEVLAAKLKTEEAALKLLKALGALISGDDEAKKKVATEQRQKFVQSPAVVAELAKMRAEELTSKAAEATDSADALLDELLGDE